jgi:hypothetical protein
MKKGLIANVLEQAQTESKLFSKAGRRMPSAHKDIDAMSSSSRPKIQRKNTHGSTTRVTSSKISKRQTKDETTGMSLHSIKQPNKVPKQLAPLAESQKSLSKMMNTSQRSDRNESQMTTAGATPDPNQKKPFVNYANLEEMEEKLRQRKFDEIESDVKNFVDYTNVLDDMKNAFGVSGGIGIESKKENMSSNQAKSEISSVIGSEVAIVDETTSKKKSKKAHAPRSKHEDL